jgi:hypothetical protein
VIGNSLVRNRDAPSPDRVSNTDQRHAFFTHSRDILERLLLGGVCDQIARSAGAAYLAKLITELALTALMSTIEPQNGFAIFNPLTTSKTATVLRNGQSGGYDIVGQLLHAGLPCRKRFY